MKFNKWMLAIFATLAITFAPVIPASAQVTPGVIGSMTNGLNTVITATNAIYGGATNTITLAENTGLAIGDTFTKATGETGTCGLWGWFTVDGTNYSSAPDFVVLKSSNGGTPETAKTNFSPAQLSGFKGLKLVTTNNGVGQLTNNVYWRRWNKP